VKRNKRYYRRILRNGQITIPNALIKQFHLNEGTNAEITDDGLSIVITPVKLHCVHCDGSSDVKMIGDEYICRLCAEEAWMRFSGDDGK
jgi:bifunctional DNA-binding transcriptional regulator/antitoxin component of YhaV-PrlF toxin-antitoxin module